MIKENQVAWMKIMKIKRKMQYKIHFIIIHFFQTQVEKEGDKETDDQEKINNNISIIIIMHWYKHMNLKKEER